MHSGRVRPPQVRIHGPPRRPARRSAGQPAARPRDSGERVGLRCHRPFDASAGPYVTFRTASRSAGSGLASPRRRPGFRRTHMVSARWLDRWTCGNVTSSRPARELMEEAKSDVDHLRTAPPRTSDRLDSGSRSTRLLNSPLLRCALLRPRHLSISHTACGTSSRAESRPDSSSGCASEMKAPEMATSIISSTMRGNEDVPW